MTAAGRSWAIATTHVLSDKQYAETGSHRTLRIDRNCTCVGRAEPSLWQNTACRMGVSRPSHSSHPAPGSSADRKLEFCQITSA